MSKIRSFSVGNGDMFYINHNSSNFSVIDCNLISERKNEIMDEICRESKEKIIHRFISTHPDEDHINGLEFFNDKLPISNFYCVKNEATKDEESESFKYYCHLRDSKKTYYITKGCSRKWMNKAGPDEDGIEIGSSGINILWPDVNNEKFNEELKKAKDGESYNNISPIISYSLNKGVTVLWFGDLEHKFMESIEDDIDMPEADIIFAPHHGRLSGAVPEKWLKQINPKVIILGEAPSTELQYFEHYNQITQNRAKDITLVCETGKVHFYSSNKNYSCSFLDNERLYSNQTGESLEYYIGTLNL